jgi:hypothetical protein
MLALGAGGTSASAASGHRVVAAQSSDPAPWIGSCPKHTESGAGGANFKIWACGTSAKTVNLEKRVRDMAEGYYARAVALMHAPLPDDGTPIAAYGGDGRIDIYLVNTGVEVHREGDDASLGSDEDAAALTSDPRGTTTESSGYMLLNASRAATAGAAFDSDFVHEFFHVLQYQWNSGHCGSTEWWFTEASAVWAEWQLVPAARKSEVDPRTAGFRSTPGVPLTQNIPDGASDAVKDHAYDAWLWALFMDQEAGGPSVIKSVWQLLDGVETCAEMDKVLDSTLSFETSFRDFAVRNYDVKFTNPQTGKNEFPVDFGTTWQDIYPDMPKGYPTLAAAPVLPVNKTTKVKSVLKPLSAEYRFLIPAAPSTAMAVDLSSLGSNVDADLLVQETGNNGMPDRPYLRVKLQHNKFALCAMADGNLSLTAILVLSNHSMTKPASGTYAVATQSACAKTVTGNLTIQSNNNLISATQQSTLTGTNMVWKASGTQPGYNYRFNSGTITWSASADYGGCTGSGSGTAHPNKNWPYTGKPPWNYDYFQTPYVYMNINKASDEELTLTCPPDQGGGTEPYTMASSADSCPVTGIAGDELGAWNDAAHLTLTVNCTDTKNNVHVAGDSYSVTANGTFTANGLIACGAWTALEGEPSCTIDGAVSTR